MNNGVKVGSFTGNGAAQNIQLGFVPDFLLILNATDGDLVGLWFNGMTADTNVDIAAAAVTNAANGITAYEGTDAGNAKGFTVGTDYSEDGKTFRYIAVRNLA